MRVTTEGARKRVAALNRLWILQALYCIPDDIIGGLRDVRPSTVAGWRDGSSLPNNSPEELSLCVDILEDAYAQAACKRSQHGPTSTTWSAGSVTLRVL